MQIEEGEKDGEKGGGYLIPLTGKLGAWQRLGHMSRPSLGSPSLSEGRLVAFQFYFPVTTENLPALSAFLRERVNFPAIPQAPGTSTPLLSDEKNGLGEVG